MIVCHKHRFIFVKTRKTAGTSIEVALSRLCDDGDVITPVTPEDEIVRQQLGFRAPQNTDVSLRRYGAWEWRRLLTRGRRTRFYNHMPAAKIRAFVGEHVWHSYFKFCFERNPWDRIVSAYFWHRYQTGDATLDFDTFLRQQPTHILSNYPVYSIDSRVAVDFVGRYEDLLADLRQALRRIGVTDQLDLPRLKAGARTDKRPYAEIITPEQRRFIAQSCEAEIKLMRYDFDSPRGRAAPTES